jgi:hypothetical protein
MNADRPRLVVLISGSREWPVRHAHIIAQAVQDAVCGLAVADVVLMHGGCPSGVDAIADEHWRRLGSEPEVWPADWDAHGKAAGPKRNAAMVARAGELAAAGTEVVAIFCPWGRSPGTRGCHRLARAAGLDCRVFEGSELLGCSPPSARPGRWS